MRVLSASTYINIGGWALYLLCAIHPSNLPLYFFNVCVCKRTPTHPDYNKNIWAVLNPELYRIESSKIIQPDTALTLTFITLIMELDDNEDEEQLPPAN